MSTYNIREKFSYILATSSIEYIRNYNFNTSTVSDIPLTMNNSDEVIPITVNITTTVPWMQVVDVTTGKSLKFPEGNVVLEPTSSKVVLVKIDLPPEIENERAPQPLRPNISLDIKSGSFPIIPPTTSSQQTPKNTITVPQTTYTIDPGERVQVDITVYDNEGNLEKNTNVVWKSNNMSVVQVEEPQNTQVDYNPYTPRIIRGISPGETTVMITAGPERETSITFIVRDTVSSPPPPTTPGPGLREVDTQN
jgi:hypothetical protein